MEKIIIDVDPGIDDALALLLALKSSELYVEGITVVSGNVHVDKGVKNALKVISVADRVDVGVYRGSSSPLKRKLNTAEETHGRDGLGETYYDAVDLKPHKETAVNYLLKMVNSNPGKITIIALGPLSNIAQAIKADASFAGNVKKMIIMGGSARYQGNCSPVAEYNFWVDPDAARIVFKAGIPLTMVGLDVTHKVVLTPNIREVLKQLPDSTAQFICEITKFYIDFHWRQERTVGCVINDPLAVAVLLKPDLVKIGRAWVEIENRGIAIGQSVVDFGGIWSDGKCNADVCLQVDTRSFFKIFFHKIIPEYQKEIDPVIEREYNKKRDMIL